MTKTCDCLFDCCFILLIFLTVGKTILNILHSGTSYIAEWNLVAAVMTVCLCLYGFELMFPISLMEGRSSILMLAWRIACWSKIMGAAAMPRRSKSKMPASEHAALPIKPPPSALEATGPHRSHKSPLRSTFRLLVSPRLRISSRWLSRPHNLRSYKQVQ